MESVGKQKRRSKDKPSKHKARDQAITEDTPKGKRKKNHRGAPPPPTPPSDGSNTPPRAITAANQREIIEVAAELVASVPDPSIPVGASSQDDAETHTAFLRHHVQVRCSFAVPIPNQSNHFQYLVCRTYRFVHIGGQVYQAVHPNCNRILGWLPHLASIQREKSLHEGVK
jgi:hypothetical protein